MISGDFNADQFVVVTALDGIGDDLFLGRGVLFLHFAHRGTVFHGRVEIALAFQPLTDVSLAFFEKVGIDSAFLVDGNQPLQIAIGKTCSGDRDSDSGAFGNVEGEIDSVFRGVIRFAANRGAAA